MAQQDIVANVLGTIGTFLWCVQLIPQIWHNYRKKDTDGLPAAMMLIWASSSIPFGAYAIFKDFAIPLQLQPQIFAVLAVITWGQILYYDSEVSFFIATVAITGLCIVIGGSEAFLVFGSQLLIQKDIHWHTTVIAVFAAILFISGFVPALVEIWHRRGRVAGISFGFLTIDCMGALFSLAALAFQRDFDLQGGILYFLVVVIELSIATSQLVWLWRTWPLHQKAKVLGVKFDELPEAAPYQKQGDHVAEYTEEQPILGGRPGYVYGTNHADSTS